MMFEHRKSYSYIYASALAKALILFTHLHKEKEWDDFAVNLMIAVILFVQSEGKDDILFSSLEMMSDNTFEATHKFLSGSNENSVANKEYILFLNTVGYDRAKSIYSNLQKRLITYNFMEYLESDNYNRTEREPTVRNSEEKYG